MEKESGTSSNKAILASFYDDFEEFNDYCSFLCDAMSSLFGDYKDSEPDIYTILGVKRHCSWLKERAEELKNELNEIYEKSYTDSNITKIKPNT